MHCIALNSSPQATIEVKNVLYSIFWVILSYSHMFQTHSQMVLSSEQFVSRAGDYSVHPNS
jgi:hypothetical protein